ncbi:MAG: PH domain-containing protein, partial [Planctomycetota bacterium]|nr:PH domain-containing protein [Planctomycetota bacterium]
MTDQTSTCANCDRQIGRLEKSCQWQGNTVCHECYERLSRAAAGEAPAATAAAATAPAPPASASAGADEVQWSASPAVIRNVPVYAAVAILCVTAIVLAFYIPSAWAAVAIPPLLAVVVVEEVSRRSVAYSITTKRVIMERGILSKDRHEVRIADIREVSLDQTFTGRIFGFGSIGLDTAAEVGGEIDMVNIANPRRVMDLLHSLRG